MLPLCVFGYYSFAFYLYIFPRGYNKSISISQEKKAIAIKVNYSVKIEAIAKKAKED